MRYFFFFSSRRRHTRCSRDWSSDVCSSDLGDDRSEVAARAVAADRNARRVDLQGLRIPMDELGGKETVVHRRREWVLRGQAIVDREYRAARTDGELPAEHVVRVEVAYGPAAAMEKDQRRQAVRHYWPIGTDRHRAIEYEE